MSKIFLVAAYEVDMSYGGPEEGGWWYDRGELIRVLRVFHSEDDAIEWCYNFNGKLRSRKFGPNKGRRPLSSVLSTGEVHARVCEGTAPAYFPERRPHYE